MVRDDGAELESLKREVEYLRSEHVALGHEHRKEMNEKEGMLTKRLKRAEKAEQLVSTLKRGRNELQQQLCAFPRRLGPMAAACLGRRARHPTLGTWHLAEHVLADRCGDRIECLPTTRVRTADPAGQE